MFKKSLAAKEQVKLMIGLTGVSGSGKTYSALQLAYGLTNDWSKIVMADTENRSALYYAGERTGLWEHIDFPPTMPGGYHPTNWVNLINFAESDPKTEVLILDSISHEWEGIGGCLRLVEAYSKSAKGNTFTPWKDVTPLHDSFIDKMRSSRLHIIATMRSSSEYALETGDNGKVRPRKIGMKPTQRAGLEYEFGIMFDIELSHHVTTSKDRTQLFADQAPFLITAQVGERLNTWAKEGLSTHDKHVEWIISNFGKFGITAANIEEFVGRKLSEFLPEDFSKISAVWPQIKEGKMLLDDFVAHSKLQTAPS